MLVAAVTRKAMVADYLVHHGRPRPADHNSTRLIHASCRRGLQACQQEPSTASLPAHAACLSCLRRKPHEQF